MKKIDFEQERQWWNSKASTEESDIADMPINRMLRWRELERHLEGIETILEIGGGTGAFSIPLAKRGFRVTILIFQKTCLLKRRQKLKKFKTFLLSRRMLQICLSLMTTHLT